MDFSLEALGSVIRERREAKVPPMTQDELGRRAGYGAGAAVSISRIEAGLTRPGSERFAGIAAALGLTPSQLEDAAGKRTAELGEDGGAPAASRGQIADERPTERIKRIQEEVDRRTSLVTELADQFNAAHDRARDEYFMKFVAVAAEVNGAPQPDPAALEGSNDSDDVEAEAARQFQWTSYGVGQVLAGTAGAAAGGAAGAAVGGAAAYGTFMAAASFGTASTGAAIAGLNGVAATNAALALLGGGAVAAGGAGVAGGTLLLTGIVAAPALLLAAGGLAWMVRRNRKQQQELIQKLDEADGELTATKRGFDALTDFLPRATKTLDYIATHAAHALKRWEQRLEPPPRSWESMSAEQRQYYQDFVDISAVQLAVATIDVQNLMRTRGDEREQLIRLTDEVLTQAQSTAESLV